MMATKKQELEIDVLTAARQRIADIYERFDNVSIAFSGGKDSLAVLQLAKEHFASQGWLGKRKINVTFYDEEIIQPEICDYVFKMCDPEIFELNYLVIQLQSSMYYLGKTLSFIQWDMKREKHFKAIPWQYNPNLARDKIYKQTDVDYLSFINKKGTCCQMTGVRASESLVRWKGVMNSRGLCYISRNESEGNKHIRKGKPIYDWEENDVIKYLHESGVGICDVYNKQIFAGARLRVSTPFHTEVRDKIHQNRVIDPQYWDEIIKAYPEITVTEKYHKDLKKTNADDLLYNYPPAPEGIYWYINNHLDPELRPLAMKRVASALSTRRNKTSDNNITGGYPYRHIFKILINGTFKREIMPQKPKTRDMKYEEYCNRK